MPTDNQQKQYLVGLWHNMAVIATIDKRGGKVEEPGDTHRKRSRTAGHSAGGYMAARAGADGGGSHRGRGGRARVLYDGAQGGLSTMVSGGDRAGAGARVEGLSQRRPRQRRGI